MNATEHKKCLLQMTEMCAVTRHFERLILFFPFRRFIVHSTVAG
jgi:hypothetical protein